MQLLLTAAFVIISSSSCHNGGIVVNGYEAYQSLIPNGNSFMSYPALGHIAAAGSGPRNQFGIDFSNATLSYTADFCKTDSDNDGVSNGAELGDPCCVWSSTTNTFLISEGISHPGLASDTTTSEALINPDCSQFETTESKDVAASSGSTVVNIISLIMIMVVVSNKYLFSRLLK